MTATTATTATTDPSRLASLPSPDLIARYDVPGPRYTSYPTVPCWDGAPSARAWLGALDEALERERGAAVYVHIPFCRSLCTYCGCTTRITQKPVGGPYVATLAAEWRILREGLGRRSVPIGELHLGGGTPTFLSPDELSFLCDELLAEVTSDAELSLEADPRVTTDAHLQALASRGFRRLSLGVQDFDATVQRAIHRVQSEAQVRDVTEWARALGFESVGYDLVYGLPHQTLASIDATIAAVLRLAPDRIAFYGYAHVPWVKRAQRGFSEADLPDATLRRALYEHGRELLTAAGYQVVGMDHFALPTDRLALAAAAGTVHRNFMGYTHRRSEPLIGLGVSAIGDSGRSFAQNEKEVEDYERRVGAGTLPLTRGHVLTHEDRVLRDHILALMTRFETTWVPGGEGWTPFLDTLAERLAPMCVDGLVQLEAGSCRLTTLGERFVRNACMAFDERLSRRIAGTNPVFSRTA